MSRKSKTRHLFTLTGQRIGKPQSSQLHHETRVGLTRSGAPSQLPIEKFLDRVKQIPGEARCGNISPVKSEAQFARLLLRQRIVHLLRTAGPLARADLADQLGLTRSSMTTVVGDLVDDGTLVELDERVEGPGYRGRPRILLGCNPGSRRVLGVLIDERRTSVVLANAAGDISGEGETPTAGRTPESLIQSIIEIAKRLIDADPGCDSLAAIGVCLPGLVDTVKGMVIESRTLGWSDIDLGGPISRALGTSTAVQDTTQALALAEAIAGEARSVPSAVILDCGGHVGVGLITDGRPFMGSTGIAGAIGHIPGLGGSGSCRCGRIGCLAGLVALDPSGAPGLNLGADATVEDVVERIAQMAIFVESLLDPEVLIVTGPLTELDRFLDTVAVRIDEIRPPERWGRTTTIRSRIGRDKRVAVIVALQQFDPDIAGMAGTT